MATLTQYGMIKRMLFYNIFKTNLSTLPPLHVPMEKHDNIMEEKKTIERNEFER